MAVPDPAWLQPIASAVRTRLAGPSRDELDLGPRLGARLRQRMDGRPSGHGGPRRYDLRVARLCRLPAQPRWSAGPALLFLSAVDPVPRGALRPAALRCRSRLMDRWRPGRFYLGVTALHPRCSELPDPVRGDHTCRADQHLGRTLRLPDRGSVACLLRPD